MIHRLSLLSILVGVALSGAQVPPASAAPKIRMQFNNVPVADAVKQLGKQIDALVVLEDGVEGNVSVNLDVPPDRAVYLLGGLVQAVPQPALILCAKDEARGPHQLTTTAKLAVELADGTKLKDAAAAITAQARRRVLTTSTVADKELGLKLADVTLGQVLEAVAEKVEGAWVEGWVLHKIDPAEVAKGLEAIAKLPPEQQKKMVDGAIDQGLAKFHELPPDQRQEAVQRAAQMIDAFATRMNQADDATRTRFKQVTAPLLAEAVRKFVTLNARDQAELMPVIKALAKLR